MRASASSARYTFRRPALAASFCSALSGEGLLDARSGLFLAAPRRMGKSTFVREDLIPAAEQRGWTTVYVNLWSNKAHDPAKLIADAIKHRIADYDGVATKALVGRSRPSRMPATYVPTVIPESIGTRARLRDGPLASHTEREVRTA